MTHSPRFLPQVRTWVGAAVTLLLAASPALAQDPPPAAPPAAEVATPPPPPPPPGPMEAFAAPKSPHDMTGSIGFGLGLVGSTQIVGTTSAVQIRYWMSDSLVLAPSLFFNINNTNAPDDSAWQVAPELVALFVPWQATSTRLLAGGGLGLGIGEPSPLQMDTTFMVRIPVQIGVEHFFARWFSLGIAARSYLFDYQKTGDAYTMNIELDTTQLLGSVIIYTD
jgi:hypothetical protein